MKVHNNNRVIWASASVQIAKLYDDYIVQYMSDGVIEHALDFIKHKLGDILIEDAPNKVEVLYNGHILMIWNPSDGIDLIDMIEFVNEQEAVHSTIVSGKRVQRIVLNKSNKWAIK